MKNKKLFLPAIILVISILAIAAYSVISSIAFKPTVKSAIADVPKVVGSIFGGGLWMMFGSIGALFGVGGTLGTQALLKKRKTKISEQNA